MLHFIISYDKPLPVTYNNIQLPPLQYKSQLYSVGLPNKTVECLHSPSKIPGFHGCKPGQHSLTELSHYATYLMLVIKELRSRQISNKRAIMAGSNEMIGLQITTTKLHLRDKEVDKSGDGYTTKIRSG